MPWGWQKVPLDSAVGIQRSSRRCRPGDWVTVDPMDTYSAAERRTYRDHQPCRQCGAPVRLDWDDVTTQADAHEQFAPHRICLDPSCITNEGTLASPEP